MVPDLVYVVRPGDDNEELRHSLRSVEMHAAGLYRDVWIVGSIPSWVTGVKVLPLTPMPEKMANMRQSLHAATGCPDVSDEFVLFNDDIFVMEPIAEWGTFNLGRVLEVWGGDLTADPYGNEWFYAVWSTYKWMVGQGHPNPVYYENHTPLLFDRQRLADVLSRYPHDRPFAVNGVYEVAGAGGVGVHAENAKLPATDDPAAVATPAVQGHPYLSTEDDTSWLSVVGDRVRAMFPDACKYER